MQVRYSNKAVKTLARMDPRLRNRIVAKINAYAADPASLANNVIALQRTSGYRLRVGNYRVLFDIEGDHAQILSVYRVAHRKEVYDG